MENGEEFLFKSYLSLLILLPDTGMESGEALRRMVVEVNETQVEPEEVLSDQVYYYDRLTKEISISV